MMHCQNFADEQMGVRIFTKFVIRYDLLGIIKVKTRTITAMIDFS